MQEKRPFYRHLPIEITDDGFTADLLSINPSTYQRPYMGKIQQTDEKFHETATINDPTSWCEYNCVRLTG